MNKLSALYLKLPILCLKCRILHKVAKSTIEGLRYSPAAIHKRLRRKKSVGAPSTLLVSSQKRDEEFAGTGNFFAYCSQFVEGPIKAKPSGRKKSHMGCPSGVQFSRMPKNCLIPLSS